MVSIRKGTKMKEEEAKTKWCPMARVVVNAQGFGAGNRFDDSVPNPEFMQSRCIASDCMMWCEYKDKYAGLANGSNITIESPEGGYCGLVT
jgi:hypothetical protein